MRSAAPRGTQAKRKANVAQLGRGERAGVEEPVDVVPQPDVARWMGKGIRAAGLSVAELSARTGVAVSTIRRLAGGCWRPRGDTRLALEVVLGPLGPAEEPSSVFGAWLARQMAVRRLSVAAAAALIGINHSSISGYLRGRVPNAASAAKIRTALGAAPPLPMRGPPADARYPGLARWMHHHAERLGLSSLSIASAIGRAPSCVIGLLAGRNLPQLPTRRKLAELFGEPMPGEAFILAGESREGALPVPKRGAGPPPMTAEPRPAETPSLGSVAPMTLTYAGVPISFQLETSNDVVVTVDGRFSLRVPGKAG
ncbi:hypothetical protein [Falsiroseomonas sp. HW251]|uniref:hypothetical protein n=1 Tax=Falsiroseomonas sp. HW251 TaxID=3390998 RepID=UPI003D31CF9A